MKIKIKCPSCGNDNHYKNTKCFVCKRPIGRKFDEGKTEWTLAPWSAFEAIVKIMMFGAKKYARDNWKHVKPEIRYMDACFRHLTAWCKGEKKDSETGYSHLWHAGCCIVFMIWLEQEGRFN